MKYSLSSIIKDLLAKIPVLENRINTLSTKIIVLSQNGDEIKSRLDGNEFVKSKNGENNIALKYEQKDGEDKKTLHAYVDGVEVPLASQNGDGEIKRFYKIVASFQNTNHYHEGNSSLEGPHAYHGIVGTFSVPELALYEIKCIMDHSKGYGWNAAVAVTIDQKARDEDGLWWHDSSYNKGIDVGKAIEKSTLVILQPGEHILKLWMDADNDGPSDVYFQEYEIIEILPL